MHFLTKPLRWGTIGIAIGSQKFISPCQFVLQFSRKLIRTMSKQRSTYRSR